MPKPTKWGSIMDPCGKLAIGESFTPLVHAGVPLKVFSNQLRSMLHQTFARYRWSVKTLPDGTVTVTKTGMHESIFDAARAQDQQDESAVGTFEELDAAIRASAIQFGADEPLLVAARVMAAGIFTREVAELAALTGLSTEVVSPIAARLAACPIWSDPHAVPCGDPDLACDLGFWMNAMVAAGSLVTDDCIAYGLPDWKDKHEKEETD